MQTIGTDPNGIAIPGVPEPGDPIRVLFIDPELPRGQAWMGAYLVRIDDSGLWWVPDDDSAGATWTPWRSIASVEGPEM